MSEVRGIFEQMSANYVTGKIDKSLTYYFSVGDEKWTVICTPDSCDAKPGKLTDNADCVVKVDPKLFVDMVKHGKRPGTMDLMRGRLKTSDVSLLQKMTLFFGVSS